MEVALPPSRSPLLIAGGTRVGRRGKTKKDSQRADDDCELQPSEMKKLKLSEESDSMDTEGLAAQSTATTADDTVFKRPLDPPPRKKKHSHVPSCSKFNVSKKTKKTHYMMKSSQLPPFPHSRLPDSLPMCYERPKVYGKYTLPRNVRPELLEELRMLDMEEEMLKDGTHPEVVALERQMEELERLMEESVRSSIEKDVELHDKRWKAAKDVVDREMEARTRDLSKTMKMENEERFKTIDAEIAAMCLEGPVYVPPPVNKKSLRSSRGRASDHGPSTPSEGKGKKKNSQPPVSHLLQESEIYRDLRRLGKLDSNVLRHVVHHKTSLDNQKMVYEGKSYPRGQSLFLKTEQFSQFPAVVQSLCEQWIQFKSTIAGDTRSVTATVEDLETGRVLVSKKPFV